ncbi:MAG: WD40/YVTN/BNR-like repeat-containing protein [Ferruginibacter sp.]
MKLYFPFILLFISNIVSGQLTEPIHRKINIANFDDSRFYQSAVLPQGWVTCGRAVNSSSKKAIALVYIHQSAKEDTLIQLDAGINCRFYTVVADTDSSFIAAGYIGYSKDSTTRTFFTRWNLSGQLIDSVSYHLGDASLNIVSDLQFVPGQGIFAWCSEGEEERGHPYLLQLNHALKLIHSTSVQLPTQLFSFGNIIYVPERNQLLFKEYNDTTCILGWVDFRGNIIDSSSIYINYNYYNPSDTTVTPYSYINDVAFKPYSMLWYNNQIYISGMYRNKICLVKLSTDFELLVSNIIYSSNLNDEAGDMFINSDGLWMASLSKAIDNARFFQKLQLLDTALRYQQVLYTHLSTTQINLLPLTNDEVLLTGNTDSLQFSFPSWTIASVKLTDPISPKFTWSSLEGPLGADATAFTIDDKGNYWLGTGSSGGVYFSKDRGNTWNPMLKGMGAMHVSALLFKADTLWAKVEDMRLKELLPNTKIETAYFYLSGKKKKQQWKWVSDDAATMPIEKSIRYNDILLFNRYQENFPLKKTSLAYSRLIQYYKGFGVDFKNESFDLYQHEVSNRFIGFHAIDSSIQTLNASFPPDVFELNRNIDLDNERMILLSKTGLYFSENKQALYAAPRNGLTATDVRLLRKRNNGDLVALVGTGEIWCYRNATWKMLFTTNDYFRKYGKDSLDVGLDIPTFDVAADGTIVFPFGADMWEINAKDIVQPLLFHGNLLNEFEDDGNASNVNLFGGTKIAEEDYLLLGVSRIHNFQLFRWKAGILSLLNSFPSPVFTFAYTDKIGSVWIVSDSVYLWNKPSVTLQGTLERNGVTFSTAISSNEKGNVVVLANNVYYLWEPTNKEWFPYLFDFDASSNARAYSSIAISENKQVYVGTAPYYSIGCGFSTEGYPDGVFYFTGNKLVALKNNINNWIYALEFDANDELCSGTSGSGVLKVKPITKK